MTLAAAIVAVLNAAADAHGIERALLRALAIVESKGNPRAVSKAGAMGLLQLMPQTAAALGVKDPFDAAQSADGGARLLAFLLQRFGGDEKQAIAAYNWGAQRVARGGAWPQSVRVYVARVLQARDAERGPFDEERTPLYPERAQNNGAATCPCCGRRHALSAGAPT